MTATGKNISSSPEPENLEAIVDSLICQKVSFACFSSYFFNLLGIVVE